MSYRDPKFICLFWRTIWGWLGTKLSFSTSCHPQMDGQTEVVKKSLSTMLRALLKCNHRSWDDYLPHVQFSYNRVAHKMTTMSPFEVMYGFILLLLLIWYPFQSLMSFYIKIGFPKLNLFKNCMRGLIV